MWPRCANVPMEEEYLASVVRWRCFASPPPNGDDLYHLVILPMPCTLQELDILFRILQFDNFRFLARASLSLTWFGLVCDALLGGAFLSVFRKVDGGVRNDVGGRRERPPPPSWRHEGMGKHERRLIPHWKKSLEKWDVRNAMPHCTEHVGPRRRGGACGGIRVVGKNVSRRPLEVHIKREHKTKQIHNTGSWPKKMKRILMAKAVSYKFLLAQWKIGMHEVDRMASTRQQEGHSKGRHPFPGSKIRRTPWCISMRACLNRLLEGGRRRGVEAMEKSWARREAGKCKSAVRSRQCSRLAGSWTLLRPTEVPG